MSQCQIISIIFLDIKLKHKKISIKIFQVDELLNAN